MRFNAFALCPKKSIQVAKRNESKEQQSIKIIRDYTVPNNCSEAMNWLHLNLT